VRAYISGALNNVADLSAARALYERLGDACEQAGWEAYVPHRHADPERDPHMPNREVAERDLTAIASSEVLVAHLGEPSLGVGAEIAIAIHSGKSVLAVAGEGQRVSRFALGLIELHSGQAAFRRYRSVDEACAWIRERLTGGPR
jgi:nucleoside 2-deoxyribosyltransferase